MDVISSTDVISTIKTLLNPWLKIQIDQDKFDKLIQSFQAIILKQIGQDSEKKYWGIGGGLLNKVSVFACLQFCEELRWRRFWALIKPWKSECTTFLYIIWHRADVTAQVQEHNMVCVERPGWEEGGAAVS